MLQATHTYLKQPRDECCNQETIQLKIVAHSHSFLSAKVSVSLCRTHKSSLFPAVCQQNQVASLGMKREAWFLTTVSCFTTT